MLSFEPHTLSPAQLQGYLQSAVAPRPIAFASTVDANGNPNLSPFSFFMCLAPIRRYWFFRRRVG